MPQNNSTSQDNLIFADLPQSSRKIKHYTEAISQNIHHFYIYGEIEDDIEKYSDLINTLKTASELDTVILYINSEGGSMRMTLQIINSMLSSSCKTVTSLDGQAFSAASMLFLAGEEYIVHDNCSFMVHTFSGGMQGKGNELFSQLEHIHSNVKNVLVKFYNKILTEEEIEKISEGQDKWMNSEELIERLDNASNEVKYNEKNSNDSNK